MWVLKKISDGAVKYLIFDRKSYTVGRKNCDIVFEEDSSISRKHCTLYITKQSECPFMVNTSTGVWLVDEQSKYGTFVRNNNSWVKISPNQNCKLSHGSIIKFGLMENIWSFEYKPLIVCTSGIPSSQKNKIESTLKSVNGELRNSWCKGCSLVVVNEITLTVKVVLALIVGVPIVTPNYIEKAVESIKNQNTLPKYEDHRPEIKESILDASLVSLDVQCNRKELFKGKTFFIPTIKQLETLKEVITSAGGKAELLLPSDSQSRFADENAIVIQCPLNNPSIPEALTKSVREIAVYLQKQNRRIIPESEIAQAVAYSSIEKYCNPKSGCFSLRRVEKKQDKGSVIVEETPDLTEQEKLPDYCFVPSSATINSEPEDIFEPHCSKLIANDAFMNRAPERKRAYSPNQLEVSQKKKQRISGKPVQNNPPVSESDRVKEKLTKTDKKSAPSKINSTKACDISNYFKKLDKPGEKPQAKGDNSDFWNYENCTLKRKNSTESNTDGESSRKKAKKQSPIEIDTPREVVEIVQTKSSAPTPPVRKIVEEDKDFDDYFGKDMNDSEAKINDLNNTIFSLTLISPVYLKEDGSLTDPPSLPVNVKKFRKQKLQSIVITDPKDPEDDLSDGEWIEPHPREIAVGDKNW